MGLVTDAPGAPVVPRDAATVMLVRDAAGGGAAPLEVCMLRRNIDSDFVGGAYVFPGGKVDEEDRSALAGRVCSGRDDPEASGLLGVDSGGLAFWVAALRECFEEAGVLLAYPERRAGGEAVAADRSSPRQLVRLDDAERERLAALRAQVNAGEIGFLEACLAEGWALAVDQVHYFSHWITPEGVHKRYDTRFFVAALPPGQVPVHDDYETVDTVWVRPAEAIERHRAGELELIFPTIKNLEAIGKFATSEELLEAAMAIEHVPTVLPRVAVDGRGYRILLPGDPGYDELLGSDPPSGIRLGQARPATRARPLTRQATSAPSPLAGAVELAPGVVRLVAPNAGMMTGPGTNSYLIGETELVVVDPGPADPAHIDALVEAGRGRIRWVVVTHTHSDHAPGAAALAARTGAEVLGFEARDGFVPDRTVGEGFVLRGEGFSLRALHTPGHASDHLCWLLEDQQMLFSGDHVMEGSTVVIAPPDGDMAAYLASLGRLQGLDPPLEAIAPGHGALVTDPASVLAGYVEHRLAREGAVAAALAGAHSATIDELLPTVYADVATALYPVARYSLWAHLRKLAAEGRATAADPGDIDTVWEATSAA